MEDIAAALPIAEPLLRTGAWAVEKTGVGKGLARVLKPGMYVARGTAKLGNNLLLKPGAALARGTAKLGNNLLLKPGAALARGTAMAGNRLLLKPGAALARGTGKVLAQGALNTFQGATNLTNKKRGQYRPIQTAVIPGLGNCRWVGMFPPPDTYRVGGTVRTRQQQLNQRTRKENGRRTQSRRQRLQSTRTTRSI
jgi:hypothetical protein